MTQMNKLIEMFISATHSELFLPQTLTYTVNKKSKMEFGSIGSCMYLHCANMINIIKSSGSCSDSLNYNLLNKQKEYLEKFLLPWSELFTEYGVNCGDNNNILTKVAMLPELIFEVDLYLTSILLSKDKY